MIIIICEGLEISFQFYKRICMKNYYKIDSKENKKQTLTLE